MLNVTEKRSAVVQLPRAISGERRLERLLHLLNTRWHKRALFVFLAIVLGHWAEHIVQAVQYYVLGWPAKRALGLVGIYFPWLIRTEALHWALNFIIAGGLVILLPAFRGRARTAWLVAIAIQAWHFFEHTLLFGQFVIGKNLLGRPVPTSIIQIWIPRISLHLFYNAIVTVPLLIGVLLHLGSSAEALRSPCSCRGEAAAAA